MSQNLDLPPDGPTTAAPRRLIVLVVEPAHDIGIDYEGEFALWEVRSVLEAALDKVITDEANETNDIDGDEGTEESIG